jgi:hypothetical protein
MKILCTRSEPASLPAPPDDEVVVMTPGIPQQRPIASPFILKGRTAVGALQAPGRRPAWGPGPIPSSEPCRDGQQAFPCIAKRNGRENSAIKIVRKQFSDFVVVPRAHPNIQC